LELVLVVELLFVHVFILFRFAKPQYKYFPTKFDFILHFERFLTTPLPPEMELFNLEMKLSQSMASPAKGAQKLK